MNACALRLIKSVPKRIVQGTRAQQWDFKPNCRLGLKSIQTIWRHAFDLIYCDNLVRTRLNRAVT